MRGHHFLCVHGDPRLGAELRRRLPRRLAAERGVLHRAARVGGVAEAPLGIQVADVDEGALVHLAPSVVAHDQHRRAVGRGAIAEMNHRRDAVALGRLPGDLAHLVAVEVPIGDVIDDAGLRFRGLNDEVAGNPSGARVAVAGPRGVRRRIGVNVHERRCREFVAQPMLAAGSGNELHGALGHVGGRQGQRLHGLVLRIDRPPMANGLPLLVAEVHLVGGHATRGGARCGPDGHVPGDDADAWMSVLERDVERFEGWGWRHRACLVNELHPQAGTLVFVLPEGGNDLKAVGRWGGRVQVEFGERAFLCEPQGPPACGDTGVREPHDLAGALGNCDPQGEHGLHLAAKFLATDGQGVVVLLGGQTCDNHSSRSAHGDGRLLAVKVGGAVDDIDLVLLVDPDDLASLPGACGLGEARGRHDARKGASGPRGVAPVNIVVGDGFLLRRALDEHLPIDTAFLEVCITAEAGGFWQELGDGEVLQGHVRRLADLRMVFADGAAGDDDQGVRVARGREGAVDVQRQLRGARGGDRLAQGLELEARLGHEVHTIILDVGLGGRRSDGHNAGVGANCGILIHELDGPRRVLRRVGRVEGPSGLQRVLGVDEAACGHPALQCAVLLDAVQENLLHLGHRQVRAVHPHERGDASDMWGGHGRAAQVLVSAPRHRRINLAARRGDVDGGFAEAGKARQLAAGRRRCDGHDVRDLVIRRVVRFLVVVCAGVPRGGHEEQARGLGALDGHAEGRGGAPASPRVAQDLGAVRDRIIDGADGVGGPAGAVASQELQRHDPHTAPRDAGHAEAVVADAGDRTGAVRAVELVVHRVPVVVREVGAVDIVDVAVPIVVDAVAGDLVRVHPHLLPQVLVSVVDAGVDDADGDASALLAGPNLPSLGGVDVIGAPGVHAPKPAELGVVWHPLVGACDLADAEVLPSQVGCAVAHDIARGLDGDEFAMERLDGERPVHVAVHQLELLPVADVPAVRHEPARVLGGEERAEARLERDGLVVVVEDQKLAGAVHLWGASDDRAGG
mmetsp:Transcript_58955/g.171043  ORF Transcript_58955/g.171043 Transcript_58955/m.171043 type:complete len:1022 (-) Transcript_58955:661-3726(-)